MSDKTGSLAKGKLAELALIDGDPSKDITQLRQVELVMRDGKMMQASELQRCGARRIFGGAQEIGRSPNGVDR